MQTYYANCNILLQYNCNMQTEICKLPYSVSVSICDLIFDSGIHTNLILGSRFSFRFNSTLGFRFKSKFKCRYKVSKQQYEKCNLQTNKGENCNLQIATWKLQPVNCNLQTATLQIQPATSKHQLSNFHLHSEKQIYANHTLKPEFYIGFQTHFHIQIKQLMK